MKKVAIYARVSTEKQAEEQTIESQLAELREVCNGHSPLSENTPIEAGAERPWTDQSLTGSGRTPKKDS
jgi:DNA invertase Pin-like site-specific DNA recombinase